eukprot:comp22636_c0_seq1/m.34837 comp22636_c0_seq1/g.34837  ORF comp22636_c0_seq1/g.34837 comp22636_c0_seq1/m.34837 type:complete len:387 (-) comp22636_c0_seq1:680-1840(-)
MSSFGRYFRVTTFGESHCKGVGCIVDGVPPQMALTEDDIQPQLTRRRPGQSKMTTPRDEKDRVTILSGTERGLTLGTPIGLLVFNEDQRPGDYKEMNTVPRPSHADYTYIEKYGIHSASGGGRSSARETIGRVAAGAIAEKWLREQYGIEIVAFVSSVGPVHMPLTEEALATVTREQVDKHMIRCPDQSYCDKMAEVVLEARNENDSIGGGVGCVIRGIPTGWGEPCFDKLEALLAHAMLSIPATKGFEIGSGFKGTEMRGHVHNDPFVKKADGTLGTKTNNSGGIQGGISNSMPVYFRIAFKPPATISQAQSTVDFNGEDAVLEAKGRHDPCVVPRAVPIVEAMAALVLADVAMAQLARQASIVPPSTFPRMPEAKRARNGDEAH